MLKSFIRYVLDKNAILLVEKSISKHRIIFNLIAALICDRLPIPDTPRYMFHKQSHVCVLAMYFTSVVEVELNFKWKSLVSSQKHNVPSVVLDIYIGFILFHNANALSHGHQINQPPTEARN